MYTFDIIVQNTQPDYDQILHDSYTLLHMLENSGQILERQPHLLEQREGFIKIAVACPELDSLDTKHCNPYALEWLERIETGSRAKVAFNMTGHEPEYPLPRYAVPKKSSHYILRYGWHSPLLCGDTHTPIPLYKIPYTDTDGKSYDNIKCWEHHHQSLYRLWLSSQPVTEAFAQTQLQAVDSEHNRWGRSLCKLIEDKTGVPTYYFLFNSRHWSTQEDLARKCPLTGQDWLIEGATAADFIAFKCADSRLMSALSHDADGVIPPESV